MDYELWLKEGLIVLAILLGAFLIGKIVLPLLTKIFEKIAKSTPTDIDNQLLKLANRPIKLLLYLIALFLINARLPLPDKAQLIANGIVFVFAVYVVIKFIGQAWLLILEWWGGRLKPDDSQVRFQKEFIPLIKLLSWILLYVIGTAVVLKHFKFDILSLVTALGVGSLAVGLAAKDTLANIISGFVILLDRPFRPGDRIQLEDGTVGDVDTIGIRSTKIKTFDKNLLIVPNQNIMNSTIINFAYPDLETRVVVEVGVDYGANVEEVKKLLVEIANNDKGVLKSPGPSAYFISFGDSALNMKLISYVSIYNDVYKVRDRLNTTVHQEFAKHKINIPFPIRTVFLNKEA